MHRHTRSLSLLAAVLVAGCRPITEPAPFDVRFVSSLREGVTLRDQASYGTTTGTIVVMGEMATDSPCLTLTPQLRRAGTDLVISIAADESRSGCAPATSLYSYSLRIGRVPAASYRVTVYHSVRTATTQSGGTVLFAPAVVVP